MNAKFSKQKGPIKKDKQRHY